MEDRKKKNHHRKKKRVFLTVHSATASCSGTLVITTILLFMGFFCFTTALTVSTHRTNFPTRRRPLKFLLKNLEEKMSPWPDTEPNKSAILLHVWSTLRGNIKPRGNQRHIKMNRKVKCLDHVPYAFFQGLPEQCGNFCLGYQASILLN